MASAEQLNFIRQIGPMVREEAIARGYLVASPIIAQATVESFKGTGLSGLATKYHNYFGMKCGSSWKGRSVNLKTGEEYTPGTITQITAAFRVYDDMRSGVRGYFDFISTSRYKALKSAATPKEYLERIKAAGYATSSTYVQTNMKRISLYNLTDYDKCFGSPPASVQERPVSVNPYPVPTQLLRRGSKGIGVRWLQRELVSHGFHLLVDGIFGPKTEHAVLDFQRAAGLKPDALVGPLTRNALLKCL